MRVVFVGGWGWALWGAVLTAVCAAVPVADIKAVITGKDCPHMKEKGALKQNKVGVEAAAAVA